MEQKAKFKKDVTLSKLDENNILIAEFNYAAQSAFQANEDRVRIFNFVFANILTLAVSLALPVFNNSLDTRLFGYVFIALSGIGVLSLLQLIRLRAAWRSSILTMNQIKDYYVKHGQNDLAKAFKWTTSTIPSGVKVFSLSFLMGLALILLNSFATSAAVYFLLSQRNLHIAITGITLTLVQLLFWVFANNRD